MTAIRLLFCLQKSLQFLLCLALSLGITLSSVGASWAKSAPTPAESTSETAPLQVKLLKTVTTEQAHYGDPFEAVLTEDYQQGDRLLPAGTVFKGQVQSSRGSMILAMPGYVVLDVKEAKLPSGTVVAFNQGTVTTQPRLYHPKAHFFKKIVKGYLPFALMDAAIAIPLNLTTGLSGLAISPITMAARGTVGSSIEVSRKNPSSPVKNAPAQTRLGFGMLQGTGAVGTYLMLHPSPEPDLRKDAIIPLRLEEKDITALLDARSADDALASKSVKLLEGPLQKPVVDAAQPESLHSLEVETQSFESVHAKIPQQAVQPVETQKQ